MVAGNREIIRITVTYLRKTEPSEEEGQGRGRGEEEGGLGTINIKQAERRTSLGCEVFFTNPAQERPSHRLKL